MSFRRAALAVAALSAGARIAQAQTVSTNPWSLGIDASLSSLRTFAGDQKGSRQNVLDAPGGLARVGYRVSPRLQLEVPFALSTFNTKGFSMLGGTVGLDANLFLSPRSVARPFVGGGGFVTYSRTGLGVQVLDGASSVHTTNVGLVGRVGAELQATPTLSFRPALFYRHRFEKTDESVGFDQFGGELGGTVHFGQQGTPATEPSPVQLGFGAELARNSYGSTDDDITVFQAPSAVLGVLVPLSRVSRASVGTNVAFSRNAFDGNALTRLSLQPRLEVNANRSYRTERSVRLGVQGDIEHSSVSGSSNASSSQYGAGLDASLTFPTARGVLSRVGLGYDYLARDKSSGLSMQSRISLKFGIDAL